MKTIDQHRRPGQGQYLQRIEYASLPPGFSYAPAPRTRRSMRARWLVLLDAIAARRQPRYAITRIEHSEIEAVDVGTAETVIDLYPTRQRVRVRRRRSQLHGPQSRGPQSRGLQSRGPQTRGPKPWGLLVILLLIGILGGYWYQQRSAGEQAPSIADAVETPVGAPATGDDPLQALLASEHAVIAKAIVKPARTAALGFPNGGRVKSVWVREGALVYPGEPLVQLDDTRGLVAVAQARAQVQQAEADLLDLQSGARTEELAAAEAVVDRAQAQLDLLLSEASDADVVRTAELAAAEATLSAALAQLDQLYAGAETEQLIGARAAMHKAEAQLAMATAAYDAVKWRNDVAMLPESMQLQQATIELEAAQANYNLLLRGADDAAVRTAVAEVERARVELARLQQPVRAGELASARAALREAEAQYALLRAGPRLALVSRAEAMLTAARVTLMDAEATLTESVLTAPFTATVAALTVTAGEQVAPGATVAQLGDFTEWALETVDLVELDVARVVPGALVAITLDALPDALLAGRVDRIKPLGEDKVGDMTYTVYITLDEHDLPLAWNMSATVYVRAPQ